MMFLRRPLFILALFCSLLLVACDSGSPKRLQVGDSAPRFSGTDLSGRVISLKQLKGKSVVLRFFLPDCQYCKADTEIFNRYYERHHAKGLEIIYIATSPAGEIETIRRFAEDLGIKFPVIHDSTGKIAASYLIKAVPQTIILSPELTIKGAILGGVSEAELNQLLNQLH